MSELNDPMSPDILDPDPHRPIAGDIADDDGPALDQYFEAGDTLPVEYDTLPDPYAKDKPRETTRLITRTFSLASPDGIVPADPIMLLPADPNRVRLLISVSSAGAGNGVRVGESKSDVYGAPRLNIADTYDLTGHTGSIWVYNDSTNIADIVTVNAFVVSM